MVKCLPAVAGLNCQWLNGCNGQWSLVNRKKEKGKNGLMVKWLIVND